MSSPLKSSAATSFNKPQDSVQNLCNRQSAGVKPVPSVHTPLSTVTTLSAAASSTSISSSLLSKPQKIPPSKTGNTSDNFGFASLVSEANPNHDKPLNLVTKDIAGASFKSDKDGGKSYKSTHPIGSRKATESVITYHEPMFQSVANTLFEKQKSLILGKRKMDGEEVKTDSNSSDQKKAKLNTLPNMADVKISKKKKCSIENIIERIRTEKTVSRGSATASPQNVQSSNTDSATNQVQYKNTTLSVSDATDKHVQDKDSKAHTCASDSRTEEKHSVIKEKTDVTVEKKDIMKKKEEELKEQKDDLSEKKAVTKEKKDMIKQTGAEKNSSVQKVFNIDNVTRTESVVCKLEPKEYTENNDQACKFNENIIENKPDETFGCLSDKVNGVSNGNKTKGAKKSTNLERAANPKGTYEDIVVAQQSKVFSDGAKETEELKKKKTNTYKANKAVQKKPREGENDLEKKNITKKILGESKIKKAMSVSECQDSEQVNSENVVEKKIKKLTEDQVKGKVKKDSVKKVNKFGQKKDEKKPKKSNKKETNSKEKVCVKTTYVEGSVECNIKDGNKKEDKSSEKNIKGKRTKSDDEKSGEISESQGKMKRCKSETTNMDEKKKSKGASALDSDSKAAKGGVKRPRKNKLPIACRRVKREASLNAATLVNILCESPRTLKLGDKRSKSDSDLKLTPPNLPSVSVSVSNLHVIGETVNVKDGLFTKVHSPVKGKSGLCKENKRRNSQDEGGTFSKPKALKSPSSKRKVSFSDESFDSVFEAVIQRSIEETKGTISAKKNQDKVMKKAGERKLKKDNLNKIVKKTKTGIIKHKSEQMNKKFRLKKIKKAIKLTASKSPDEMAEKKRKASLARLERAKELLETKKRVSNEFTSSESNSSDSDSVTSVSSASDELDLESTETDENNLTKKERAKKGSLSRSARTHICVESKTVVENAMPSPRWCECCQSQYYPSQPSQGAQVWRMKQLVDKGSSKSPEPIQTSSHHFIAAHASCEVRPYASPSHMSVLESTPYVGQIMPHGHIQCSACTCGHSGMFHTTSCQNCTLGGVGNLMSCQRYGSTYSVTYPHSHGSYTHCGKYINKALISKNSDLTQSGFKTR